MQASQCVFECVIRQQVQIGMRIRAQKRAFFNGEKKTSKKALTTESLSWGIHRQEAEKAKGGETLINTVPEITKQKNRVRHLVFQNTTSRFCMVSLFLFCHLITFVQIVQWSNFVHIIQICPHRLTVQIYNYNFTDGDVLITAAHQTMRATLVVAQVCCRLCKCGLTL